MRWEFILYVAVIVISVRIPSTLSQDDQNENWAISGALEQSKTIFDYSGSIQGNISDIEVTPKGRPVYSYYSHLANIDQGNIKLIERTSASKGTYKSEDLMKFESEKAQVADISIYSPFFGLNIQGFITTSSWDARRNIEYSGRGINDRDYTLTDFYQNGKDTNAALFYGNTEFSKERRFTSPGDFTLKAKTAGRSEFKSNYGSTDASFEKNEIYNGKFNISINNKHGFGLYDLVYNYTIGAASDDWLGDLCGLPRLNNGYTNSIVISPGSIYTTQDNIILN